MDGKRENNTLQQGYKYLVILEYTEIKESKMKENFQAEYLRRTKLITKGRLICRSKITAINTWAVSLMRYGAGILKWTKRELDETDRKTKKVMTLNKELHP